MEATNSRETMCQTIRRRVTGGGNLERTGNPLGRA
jgi:hypothetical protein